MDPLNDLIWTDEDENGYDPSADQNGARMVQICTISLATCTDSGGGGGSTLPPYSAGAFGGGWLCGC